MCLKGVSSAPTINLRSVATTLDTNANIDVSEFVFTNDKDSLVDLELENSQAQVARGADHLIANKTLSAFAVSGSSGSFLKIEIWLSI